MGPTAKLNSEEQHKKKCKKEILIASYVHRWIYSVCCRIGSIGLCLSSAERVSSFFNDSSLTISLFFSFRIGLFFSFLHFLLISRVFFSFYSTMKSRFHTIPILRDPWGAIFTGISSLFCPFSWQRFIKQSDKLILFFFLPLFLLLSLLLFLQRFFFLWRF